MPAQIQGQFVAYVRVSSTDQNPARQVAAIGDVQETFTDRVSGGSRAEQTALATMLRHVRVVTPCGWRRWTAWPARWSTSRSSWAS